MPELTIPKLATLEEAVQRREALRKAGKRIVLTNGCFDLLHTGHLSFLRAASEQADALFIVLNGDASVRELKGPTRPVQNEQERAYLLNALDFVHTILIFQTPRLCAEIEALKPDLYVKAGDYNIDSIHAGERGSLERVGAEIRFLPFLEGYSTTALIERISKAASTF